MIFCTTVGRYLSQKLYQRIKLLEQTNLMLNTIKTQIEYCNTPVREALERFKNLEFVDRCINEWEKGKQFPQAWSDSVDQSVNLNALKKADKEILKAFGNAFGTTDLNGQLNICSFYINQVGENLNDAKEQYKMYGRLYCAMGILSGTAIAIILI
ncbi:MAG: stage III sporulation protein AB [Acutalibacteraceae bacterium]|nr:hypothetical protein [Clostridiales bacterium]